VVVVDVRHCDSGWPGVLAGELVGVEDFLGHDALVASTFPLCRGVYGLGL
jgi:hypothetical protein